MRNTEGGVMTETERGLGNLWFDEVWNKGRREAIGEMFGPDATLHDGDVATHGPGAFYQFFDRMHSTFSDIRIDILDTFAEADKLCLRWSCTAQHTGNGLGVKPTHKQTKFTGISIMQIEDGRIVEAWQNWDMMGLMHQIGAAPRLETYITEDTTAVAAQ